MERKDPFIGEESYDNSRLYDRLAAGTERNREQILARQEMVELQHKLKLCYLSSGVNHFQMCKPLVDSYVERLTQWKGYIPPSDADNLDTTVRLRYKVADA